MSELRGRGWVFAQMPIWLLADQRLSDGAKIVFGYLRYRQGTDANCYPSIRTVAHDLGAAERTIQRRLGELEGYGYVERVERAGRSTLYYLVADPEEAVERWHEIRVSRPQYGGGDKNVTPTPDKNVTPGGDKFVTHDDSQLNESHEDNTQDDELTASRSAQNLEDLLEKAVDEAYLQEAPNLVFSTGDDIPTTKTFDPDEYIPGQDAGPAMNTFQRNRKYKEKNKPTTRFQDDFLSALGHKVFSVGVKSVLNNIERAIGNGVPLGNDVYRACVDALQGQGGKLNYHDLPPLPESWYYWRRAQAVRHKRHWGQERFISALLDVEKLRQHCQIRMLQLNVKEEPVPARDLIMAPSPEDEYNPEE